MIFEDLKYVYEQIINLNQNNTKYLFHYTNLNGFLGIFNKKCLWASHISFLNDTSEFEYGLKMVQDFLSRIMVLIKSEFVKRELILHTNPYYQKDILESDLFIVSFCENGDLLSQWRGYTRNNEGVALGFNQNILKEIPNINIYKVIYEKEKQKDILKCFKNILKQYLNRYEEIFAHCNISYDNYSFKLFFLNWLRELEKIIVIFKDSSFSEEREWRLIYDIKDINKNRNENFLFKNEIIKYRIKNNYLLPYIEINNLNLGSIINQVVIGPFENKLVLGKGIQHFFNTYDYKININYSEIPYRS